MADFDLTGAMPFDTDANDARPGVLSVGPFLYIGKGYSAAAFREYVASYNFGKIPPSYVVLHHTAIPSTRAARYPSGAVWDDHEAGLSPGAVYEKRRKQLDQLANYYQHTLGWDRGPHLFIDDRYIWLFTPMNAVGIHAKEGNSYGSGANLHYSIGIEVVGYYEHVTWDEATAANVRAAVQALCTRLDISPTYTPGPLHTPAAHAGSLSAHRDYNKPQCPGAAITEAYYTATVAPVSPPPTPAKQYTVKGVPIYQRTDLVGTLAGWLKSGDTVAIDKTYANGAGHLSDGRGFVDMDGLE